MTAAVYPGTFDPVTNGHLDIIRRAAAIFPSLLVAVGTRLEKRTIFTVEERVALMREAVRSLPGVTVEPFEGLIVDFAKARRIRLLVRGVRTVADFEYESVMAQTNRRLAPEVDTVFLLPEPGNAILSSTLIKEILRAGGSVAEFVPPHVDAALRRASAG